MLTRITSCIKYTSSACEGHRVWFQLQHAETFTAGRQGTGTSDAHRHEQQKQEGDPMPLSAITGASRCNQRYPGKQDGRQCSRKHVVYQKCSRDAGRSYQVEAIEEGDALRPARHGHEAVRQHTVAPPQCCIYLKCASAECKSQSYMLYMLFKIQCVQKRHRKDTSSMPFCPLSAACTLTGPSAACKQ